MNQEPPLPLVGGSAVPRRRRFPHAALETLESGNAGIGDKTWRAIVRLRKAGKTVERRGAQIMVGGALVTWDELHWLARRARLPKNKRGKRMASKPGAAKRTKATQADFFGSGGGAVDGPSQPGISPDAEVESAFALYVAMAEELTLAVPSLFNKGTPRWNKLKSRLKDAGGLDGWKFALDKIRGSAFLRGEGGRETWRGAHLDFLLQQSSFIRVMEGAYDDNPRAARKPGFDERNRTVREGVAGALGLGPGRPRRMGD